MSKEKDIFDTMDKLTRKHCFIRFFADIHRDENGKMRIQGSVSDKIYMMAGMASDIAINKAFSERFEPQVEQEGSYTIKALIEYPHEPLRSTIAHAEYQLEVTQDIIDEMSGLFKNQKN